MSVGRFIRFSITRRYAGSLLLQTAAGLPETRDRGSLKRLVEAASFESSVSSCEAEAASGESFNVKLEGRGTRSDLRRTAQGQAPRLVVPRSDKCAFSGARADAWAGGTRAGMCLSEEKLSSGALLGEAPVNKGAEFLQRKRSLN
ncbi:hypothetical protein Q8A67_019051 [Cirrhinus molitorella]|uniref:Uncharacterized protein n=1 Tax=Cirrhinus molitorella TaxID=172907 RepID=A0AA88TEP4_9TELE|nr:hypothetical protein Q8A67_019051 [Cirrhinus molitorella]